MEHHQTEVTTNNYCFDFQSSNNNSNNSFTFVDMTKDVAFKSKYEGHKCLKVNKHFRNNEHFQNNFFVFKHEDSIALDSSTGHSQAVVDNEVFSELTLMDSSTLMEDQCGGSGYQQQQPTSSSSSVDNTTNSQDSHNRFSINSRNKLSSLVTDNTNHGIGGVGGKFSSTGQSTNNHSALTFISSSPQNNFTANYNPKQTPSTKRKSKPKQNQKSSGDTPTEDSTKHEPNSSKKRKQRRNSIGTTDSTRSSSRSYTTNIRKRKRAGSVSSCQFITLEPFSNVEVDLTLGNLEDCFDLTEFQDIENTTSLLASPEISQLVVDEESQLLSNSASTIINNIGLSFDEIDELLNDFSMVVSDSRILNEETLHCYQYPPGGSGDQTSEESEYLETFFNEISTSLEENTSSSSLSNSEEGPTTTTTTTQIISSIPDPSTMVELEDDNELFDFRHQTELIDELQHHGESDLETLFESTLGNHDGL